MHLVSIVSSRSWPKVGEGVVKFEMWRRGRGIARAVWEGILIGGLMITFDGNFCLGSVERSGLILMS